MSPRPLCLIVSALLLLPGCGGDSAPEARSEQVSERSPYRERYRHLPNLHSAQDKIGANRKIAIDRGYYTGPLRLRGPGYQKRGAGIGESVIDGDLEIRGDGWILSKLTVTGNLKVWGSNNTVDVEILGLVDVYEGSGNRVP